MEAILNKVIKKKIIKLIEHYTIDGVSELVLDFPLSIGTYQSIEYVKVTNDVILHSFDSDFDYSFLFEDFIEEDKLRIYQILKGIEHLN